ncbi:MAG: DUF3857 domain-containing protein [Proteobacteria bacterium]|nr:DUF3857 domain-containing protein [Pseudomonadota bacterium]
MSRVVMTMIFVFSFATSIVFEVRAGKTRAEQELEIQWKKLRQAPGRLDAELDLIAIFKMWDRVGPAPVMRTLERATTLSNASIRIRERARHLIALGKVRLGNLDDALKSYSERGFLDDWFVAGPFDNEGGTGLDVPFSPEMTMNEPRNFKTPMPGKGRDVFWRRAPKQISFLGYNHLEALYESGINICSYALTALDAKKSGQAVLRLGAGGAFHAFWNGRRVLTDPNYRRPDPDRSAAIVHVNKGINRLLVKVCTEEDRHIGFYARLTDKAARPWPISEIQNYAKAFAVSRPIGPSGRNLAGPLDILVNRAKKNKKHSAMRASAARYLLYTGATDRSSHLARDLARSACRLNPNASNCLVWAELALDRNERRLALSHTIKAEPNSIQALLALARLEMNGVDIHRAFRHIDAALALRPDDLEARALEIEVSADQGFTLTAFHAAKKLLKNHPNIPRVVEMAAALARRSGSAADGFALAGEKLALRYDDLEKHEILARSALARQDWNAFDHHLTALERLAPFDRDVYAFSAQLLEGAGSYDKAERALRTRTELAEFDANVWKDLGLFLTRQGRREQGVNALVKALSIRPQDAWLADYLAFLKPMPRFEEPFIVPPDVFLSERGQKNEQADTRFLVDQTVIRVFNSGLSSRFRQRVIEVNNRKAARNERMQSIQFLPTSQRVKILAARVFHPDGSLENSVMRDTVPISEPWYRLYYDVEAELIELPPLAPGDVVELRYRVEDTAHRNVFNDYFGDFVFIEEEVPKNLWRYVLIAPTSRRFHFNNLKDANLNRSHTIEKGIGREVFEARDVRAVKMEHSMPGLTAAASYLHVSTYGSWAELGDWYRGLIRHQLTPDARIREKVRELTKGLKDNTQKIEAIYEWVVTATRYVGLEFGIHGYKPYRVPLVVSRGFGDCKDKASLLVSMLGEAGIKAEFVLVRTSALGDVDTFPASLSVFNHAIAHVPALDLWLDGTAEHHGPAEFPFGDQGAPALRIGDGDAVFVHTPLMPPKQNATDTSLDILLDPDGDARLQVSSSVQGRQAAMLRQELEALQTRRERFEGSLAQIFPGARLGDLEFTSLEALAEPVAYSYSAFVPAFAKTSKTTLDVPVDIGLRLTARFGRLPTREHDLVVGPAFMSSRNVIIQIPSGHSVAELPSAAIIESQFGKLSFEVHEESGAIHITRSFELNIHRVSKSGYSDFVEFCRRVDDVLAGQIRLKRMQ